MLNAFRRSRSKRISIRVREMIVLDDVVVAVVVGARDDFMVGGLRGR